MKGEKRTDRKAVIDQLMKLKNHNDVIAEIMNMAGITPEKVDKRKHKPVPVSEIETGSMNLDPCLFHKDCSGSVLRELMPLTSGEWSCTGCYGYLSKEMAAPLLRQASREARRFMRSSTRVLKPLKQTKKETK